MLPLSAMPPLTTKVCPVPPTEPPFAVKFTDPAPADNGAVMVPKPVIWPWERVPPPEQVMLPPFIVKLPLLVRFNVPRSR